MPVNTGLSVVRDIVVSLAAKPGLEKSIFLTFVNGARNGN